MPSKKLFHIPKYLHLFTALLLSLFLHACKPSYQVQRLFTPIEEPVKTYPHANKVELYFVGETPKFEYEKIGIVEVQTSAFVPKINMFSHIKYLGWKYGADAIIGLDQDNKNYVYSNYNSSRRGYSSYSVHVPYIKGIAVKKINVEPNNFGVTQVIDTSFTKVVKIDDELTKNSINKSRIGWTIYFVFLFVLIVIPIIFMVSIFSRNK